MIKTILDKLPPGPTMFFGALYFIMPIVPEPHLVQKAKMLANDIPLAPLDWFDVFAHIFGGVLAVAVYLRQRELKAEAANANPQSDRAKDEEDPA